MHTGANSGYRLPVIRVLAVLHLVQLKTGLAPGAFWKISQIMKIRQTLPVSEQVYPRTDYIRIDIVGITVNAIAPTSFARACSFLPSVALVLRGVTSRGNSFCWDSKIQ
jgi:hypothetical protein